MWSLISIHLEIVLVLVQDSCTIYAERTIGSENHFGCTRWYSLVTRLKWKLVLSPFGDSANHDSRQVVCAKRTIGSEIILDANDGTPR